LHPQNVAIEGELMRIISNLKLGGWILAIVLGIGISGYAARVPAAPTSQEQGHDQDYSKNKNYQQGVRDGKDDSKRNFDHSKKRHFKKDQDQKDYESGYQQGRRGDQPARGDDHEGRSDDQHR
jgi:hypothetical protein